MKPPSDSQHRITPALCRAARGFLKWTQDQLAEQANVCGLTVRNFENEVTTPHRATLAQIQMVFESTGVEFLAESGDGIGLRFGGTFDQNRTQS